MKALVHQTNNNTFIIRNSAGKVFQVITVFNEFEWGKSKWSYMTTFLVDMNLSPGYTIMGTRLKDIPQHIFKKFKQLQKQH
jgi:hypothetical protein